MLKPQRTRLFSRPDDFPQLCRAFLSSYVSTGRRTAHGYGPGHSANDIFPPRLGFTIAVKRNPLPRLGRMIPTNYRRKKPGQVAVVDKNRRKISRAISGCSESQRNFMLLSRRYFEISSTLQRRDEYYNRVQENRQNFHKTTSLKTYTEKIFI